MWTESHKICKASVPINQILPWCFILKDYGLKSQIHELNKLISASQPILTNPYPWIDFIQTKRWFLSVHFLFSHNPS